MKLHLISVVLLILLAKVNALNVFEKFMLFWDSPVCATFCSGKVSKDVNVPFFNGREHCLSDIWQVNYKNCLKRYCLPHHRRKVTPPEQRYSFRLC
jgi:hypothetical protein